MKFYLKESSSEERLIMGKLYDSQFHDGRFVYSTGERISPKQWSSGKPKKGSEELAERLLEISKQATSYIRLNRSHLTKEGLKNHLDNLRPQEIAKPKPQKNDAPAMVALWQQYLDSIKDTIAPRTYKSYHNSFDSLKADAKRKNINFKSFAKEKGWMDITPENFSTTHYNLYHGYLKKKAKPNTVAKRLKHFKKFLLHLRDELNKTVGFDVDKIKYKETSGVKISLTEEQLKKYINAEIKEKTLDEVRDLWVLQCSLGPRISDLFRIDKNLTSSKVVFETQKTKTTVGVPIPPTVRKILEKHNYKLPRISEQHYRRGIKQLHKRFFPNDTIQVRDGNEFKDVPVHEEISSHDAVRTFVTLSHERGMSVNSIAQITGKTVKVILSNYLVESQKTAEKEMEKAWGASPLKIAK